MAENTNETPQPEQSQDTSSEPKLQTENEYSTPVNQEERQYEAEKAAFERNFEDKGGVLPEQFKTVEDFFKSYKELQKSHTQKSQELAEMRRQGQTQETQNEAPQEAPEAPAEGSQDTGELRLGANEEAAQKEAEAQQDAVENAPKVAESDMAKWRNELASHGKLTDETRNEIMEKTGFSSEFVDNFAAGQRALMRESFNQAANLIDGGAPKLQEILSWAKENLDKNEAEIIDNGLQGPSWQTVLLGLEARYVKTRNQKPKAKEPQKYAVPDAMNAPSAPKGFSTMAEFHAARGDQKYITDPKFRKEVDERAMRTNWNSLPRM